MDGELNENISLPCDVYANPEPTSYKWLKNGNVIPGQSSKSLTIHCVRDKDFGNYTCQVANDVGERAFLVSLTPYSKFLHVLKL